MKKILIASLALAAIFTSCSKEQETGSFDGKNAITFELPGKKAVTYATTGTADENSLGGGVEIYMFNGGVFDQAFKPGDTGYSLTGNKLTISFDGKTGTRDFYIVGNVNNVTIPANPTEAQIKDLIANVPALTAGKYHAINPVNPGDYILMSATALALDLSTTSKSVNLVRRMARLDVVNDPAVSGINITNVLISSANVNGDAFPGSSNTQTAYTVGSIEPIALTFNASNKAEGAFYLYPTELDNTKTHYTVINLETDKGIYVVKSTKAIEANKLYTINTQIVAGQIEFTLDVADWDDADSLEAEAQTGTFGLAGTPLTSFGTFAAGTWDITGLTAASDLTLTLESVSSNVTFTADAGITVLQQSQSLTYAAKYETTFKISVTPESKNGIVTFIEGNNTVEISVVGLKNITESDANSFIMKPDDTIIFDLTQVINEGRNRVVGGDEITAGLVWTDNANGMASNGVVASLSAEGTGLNTVFTLTSGSAEGNAVVAAYKNGKVVWSWHIWVTDYNPAEDTKNFNSYVWMDRNLGAMSATPGDVKTIGMLYQWGRKDPFQSPGTWNNTEKSHYNASGALVTVTKIDAATQLGESNLDYAIENPMHFIYNSVDNTNTRRDWYTNANERSMQNDELWNTAAGEKGIYDPCPKGWRVPAEANAYSALNTTNFIWADADKGRTNDDLGFMPASGYRYSLNGNFASVGASGYSWIAVGVNGNAYCLNLSNVTLFTINNTRDRSSGFPVRCVQE